VHRGWARQSCHDASPRSAFYRESPRMAADDDRAAPPSHRPGWAFPYTVTLMAGTHVCLRAVDSAGIFGAVRATGVTHLCGAPIVMRRAPRPGLIVPRAIRWYTMRLKITIGTTIRGFNRKRGFFQRRGWCDYHQTHRVSTLWIEHPCESSPEPWAHRCKRGAQNENCTGLAQIERLGPTI
jgi:hypothetical protein